MKNLDLHLVNTLTFPNRSYSSCNSSTVYEKHIRSLTISPDRRFLLGYRYGKYDDAFRTDYPDAVETRTLYIIEVQTGKVVYETSLSSNNCPCAFSPNNQILASIMGIISIADLKALQNPKSSILNGEDARKWRSITVSPWKWTSITVSPDSLTLATGNKDNTISLWDLASSERKSILTGHSNSVTSVAFSPDGLTLASGSKDNTIHLWDLASCERKTILTGHSNSVTSVAFSPDGLTLASGSKDNTIHLWDLANYEQKTILMADSQYSFYREWVTSIAFSPDSLTLASRSEYGIRFWNLECYQLLHTINWGGVVSQDGKTFVIQADGDEKIEVWCWNFIPIQSH